MKSLKACFSTPALILLAAAVAALPASAQRRGGGANRNAEPLQFRNLGPAQAGGRVAAVVGVPGDPNVYYVGAAAGGVWKTTDAGNTWKPIFEKEPVASIGDIALAPSNPNLVWVATGEPNIRNDVMVGHGLYFSPDAGATWQEIAPQIFHNAGQMSRVVINPHDPDEVWVAVLGHAFGPNPERGVFHTTDGGKTWTKTLYVDDHTGAIDLAIKPDNPRILLAGMWDVVRHPWTLDNGGPGSGLYRSIDGGATWTKITAGLARGPYGRIGLAFAPSQPDRAYAIVQSKTGLFYSSDNAGLTWSAVSDSDQLDARPFYFSRFAVDPVNSEKIFFLALGINVSTDGGKTVSPAGRVHSDNHAIWIDPKNPDRIIEGNDGGVVLSYDGGRNFRFLDTIPIEEFYMVSASNEPAYNLCGGLQDNSAWCGPSSPNSTMNWSAVVGGDGEYGVFAPSDPHIIYGDSQNGEAERMDTRTGLDSSIKPYALGVENRVPSSLKYRFNWTTPIEVGARNANDVYLGGNVLFHSTDGGFSWTPISPDLTRNDKAKQINSGGIVVNDITGAETYDTIISIALSRTDPATIWTGADDGVVSVTHDGGKSWMRASDNIQGLPEWGRVQEIEVSPFDPNTAYVAFDFHMTDDNRPFVYKTHDGGKTWTSIAAGLPGDASARVVREDPNQKDFLVCGTDTGLFYSMDDGAGWKPLQRGFPTVPVFDIQFVKASHDLIVATHGRGLFALDNITPLEKTDPQVAGADFTLFPILTDYQLRGGKLGGGGFFGGGASGAMIYYNLKEAHGGRGASSGTRAAGALGPAPSNSEVKVAITDAQGQLVTTLNGTGRAGLNLVAWRGNYDGPRTAILGDNGGRGGFGGGFGFGGRGGAPTPPGQPVPDAGPHALAGEYTVTVTVTGLAPQKQTLRLEEDPRWPHPADAAANNAATLKAALQLRDEVSAMNQMLTRLNNLQTQLKTEQTSMKTLQQSGEGDYQAVNDQADRLLKKVAALEDEVYNPDQSKGEATVYLTDFQQDFQGLYGDIMDGYDSAPRPSDLALWAQEREQLQSFLGS
ncbi:MAG: VPS10 domain-containing protein, partial [Terriglobales bacterium]